VPSNDPLTGERQVNKLPVHDFIDWRQPALMATTATPARLGPRGRHAFSGAE